MPAKAGIQYPPISQLFDILSSQCAALEYWIPDSLASLGFGNDENGMLGKA
jgi:hypothetical protein